MFGLFHRLRGEDMVDDQVQQPDIGHRTDFIKNLLKEFR